MQRTGRRPGISTTREQIVAAAAASFSSLGYDGTSMRQVAADAGADRADPRVLAHDMLGSLTRKLGWTLPSYGRRSPPPSWSGSSSPATP
ncbi:TetR family transcriptional regulator [Nonomuraea deserti]|uniref:TetR family transcriptional regulator n=1 Tax=Nonomuraea deserti TaxID=1848322 RepID=A0A4R4TYH6_9ACTN|nr:TetR family transcriptional regulator [Nonomuraea deserti]TDC83631.1 TetR family transcriptional regulator [Nonomuraea deserti]